MKKFAVLIAILFTCLTVRPVSAAKISPTLAAQLNGLADSASVGTVIVAFNTINGLNESHLNTLRSLGITKGLTLPRLGMVAVTATAAQVRALSQNASVRSIWSNDRLSYFDNEARTLVGLDRVRTDAALTRSNGGLPVSGRGDFSAVVNDSGIDATHSDLQYGPKVIQNVQLITDAETDNVNKLQPAETKNFTPLLAVENIPNTDLNIGHGTHCAGILGGTGVRSGGRYAGVAPGVKLIGTGSGAVLFVLSALGGFEWSISNQFTYNIRIISNSFGSSGEFDPDHPLNIATKKAHDLNIVVLFSAGNSGPGKDSHNPYGKAPWVISVAMGTKEGLLSQGSSRGLPRDERLSDDNPNNDSDAPTITAPGQGRALRSNAGKFTARIISARSTLNLIANGTQTGEDVEIPAAYLPFYTQIFGTSMACPHVAGVVALMLDADPTLNPDEVKEILMETATRMPGYEDYQVGAGYVNAHAAVDKVFNRSKPYGATLRPEFNQQLNPQSELTRLSINYSPETSGADSANARPFDVPEGVDVLDVFAKYDNTAQTGDGNFLAINLYAPDGQTYGSSFSIPLLNAGTRQVVVKYPKPGTWKIEMIGYPGISGTPIPNAALPAPVDVKIKQVRLNLAPITDIQGDPAEAEITDLLKFRRMDSFADATFRPGAAVTREDFARTLALNTPLRQSLGTTPKFADVTGSLRSIAEAVTAQGSTLRDWNFTPKGLMSSSGSSFNASGTVNRLELAVALVRALGLDDAARSKANTAVTVGGVALSDNAEIPADLRGYVQIAIDKGLLEAYPAEVKQVAPGQFVALPGPRVEPLRVLTRSELAAKVSKFVPLFIAADDRELLEEAN
ncbi:MAG TPA: S8 family serine peptidase [Pyrinomonadaceae bacterium]